MKMLGDMNPGYRRRCRYAAHGCRCFLHTRQHGHRAARLRKRSAKRAENTIWRRSIAWRS